MGVETKKSAHYPPKLAVTMLKAYKQHDIKKMVETEQAALAVENEMFLSEAALAATNEELEEFKKLTGKEREQLVNAARKIHINTGHKPVTELAKLLRQNNAPKASRAAMESVKCSTCLEHSRPAPAPVASPSTAKEPWKCLGIDIKETRDKGQKLKYLVFVDEATRLVRCKLLFSIPEKQSRNAVTQELLDAFEEDWESLFGVPETLRHDPEGSMNSTEILQTLCERNKTDSDSW